jgi:hypothetical protein
MPFLPFKPVFPIGPMQFNGQIFGLAGIPSGEVLFPR